MAVAMLLMGLGSVAPAEPTQEQWKQAEALIGQLSDPEPAAREEAVEKLAALGPNVLWLIQRTSGTTTDKEVKLHCQMVLKALVKEHGADAVMLSALRVARVGMMAVGSGKTVGESLLHVVEEAPDSRYSDDALLIAGNCFLMAEDYPEAVRTFEAVIERYPRGVHVVSENWYTNVHGLHLSGSRPARKLLLDDALKVVRLYEKYLEAYPEHTCDEARYWLATVHASYLNDVEKAKEVLGKIPHVSVRESKILGYQDQIFQERLDHAITDALKTRGFPFIQLQPRHFLASSVRAFRAKLGMAVKEEKVDETPEELRREAETRVDAFLKKNMPEFNMPEVIRQEELAREEKRKRAEKEEAKRQKAYQEGLKTLKDPDASARARGLAVLAVARVGKPEALPLLRGQLNRKEFEGIVVQNTMRVLGDLRDKRAVPHLLKYLDGTTVVPEGDVEDVQRRAIFALAKIGDPLALPVLRKCLNSEYQIVREFAERAIARLERLERLEKPEQ